MSISIQILGSASATFSFNRHHSCQHVRAGGKSFLVDCGEGSQIQSVHYQVRLTRIDYILISHLHGDHYYGLVGALTSMQLGGRRKSLTIIGPPELAGIITHNFKLSRTVLTFPVEFVGWKEGASEQVYCEENLTVRTLPCHHSVPCCGFLFSLRKRVDLEKEVENLNRDEASLEPSHQYGYRDLRYAYITDTRIDYSIASLLEGFDIVYHEATFMENEVEKARITQHSTSRQAAELAKGRR